MSRQVTDQRTYMFPRTDTYPNGRKAFLSNTYDEEMNKTDDNMDIDTIVDPIDPQGPNTPPINTSNFNSAND
jgi:hypothetical protein